MQPRDDWPGDVRDVGKHARANALRDFADAFEVDDARISRRAADKQLRLMFFGEPLQLVVVDRFRFPRHAVVRDSIAQAGKIQRMAVC